MAQACTLLLGADGHASRPEAHGNYRLHAIYGMSLWHCKQFRRAELLLRQALGSGSDQLLRFSDSELRFRLAQTLCELGDSASALDELERIGEVPPPPPKVLALKSTLYAKRRRFDKALGAYEELSASAPLCIDALCRSFRSRANPQQQQALPSCARGCPSAFDESVELMRQLYQRTYCRDLDGILQVRGFA